MSISDLHHHSTTITTGGEVIILNTGAIIDSEAEAMLQALHSRSIGGLRQHLEILKKRGADNFMANFYVGYGHKSIGDCGTTTIFVEGISMLAAKAIQDWPLYSGQEASTRYIDFQVQPFYNPSATIEGESVLENWRSFYIEALEPLQEYLKKIYPSKKDENKKTYTKAIAARAFDILRGFLPAASSTNLAWHTNLRQAADKILELRHHPLHEVRAIAKAITEALQAAHPNSFGHKTYQSTEDYVEAAMSTYYYHDPKTPSFEVSDNNIKPELISGELLEKRPPKTELPKYIAEAGTMTFSFQLDFGSYRDIQRHRAVTQRMPLLTDELGFHEWYLESLPENLRVNAEELLTQQKAAIAKLNLSSEEQQYYLPMGYKVSNRLTGNLSALVYLAELRASRFVHPTLVKVATQLASSLEKELGKHGLRLHLDKEPGRFDSRRGDQDIVIT